MARELKVRPLSKSWSRLRILENDDVKSHKIRSVQYTVRLCTTRFQPRCSIEDAGLSDSLGVTAGARVRFRQFLRLSLTGLLEPEFCLDRRSPDPQTMYNLGTTDINVSKLLLLTTPLATGDWRLGGWGLGPGAWGLGPGAWGLGAGGWGLGPEAWGLGPARITQCDHFQPNHPDDGQKWIGSTPHPVHVCHKRAHNGRSPCECGCVQLRHVTCRSGRLRHASALCQ